MDQEFQTLVSMVKKLRKHQKAYFHTRQGLAQVKRLEKELDNWIDLLERPVLFENCDHDCPIHETSPNPLYW